MKKRVIAFGCELPRPVIDSLEAGFDFTMIRKPGNDPAAFAKAIRGARGLIGGGFPLSPELLDGAPLVEIVASVGVGYDAYNLQDLNRRGILLTNTPDVLTETTADTGFALIMAAARRIVELADYIKAGKWREGVSSACYGTDVYGKRLGVVGFGRIGQAVARRGHFGFGMKISYFNRSPKQEGEPMNARFCSLDQLLGESDFVCVTIPLSADTRHLIGAREFALMRPGAIFVNIARGSVVDEKALIAALEQGKIRGAGLDVFEHEPLAADSPLLSMPNVVATPHVGSATFETRLAMAELALKNLDTGLRGERPPNLVNPAAWELRHPRH